jgi:hypothetical protein
MKEAPPLEGIVNCIRQWRHLKSRYSTLSMPCMKFLSHVARLLGKPQDAVNHFMLGHLMEWFYTGLAGIIRIHSAKLIWMWFKLLGIKFYAVGKSSIAAGARR